MSKRSRALRYYRSYKPQGPIQKSLRFLIKLIVVVFLFHLLISTVLASSYQVPFQNSSDAESKQPVYAGRILASPLLYGPRLRILDYRAPQLRAPKRGAVVVSESGRPPELPWYAHGLNSISKFFTFNNFIPFNENEFSHISRYQIMRVVGMPGDEVRLDTYRIKIKTPTSSYFIDEQEVLQTDYKLVIPNFKDIGGSDSEGSQSGGLSGSQNTLRLAAGEYLLAPDNRTHFALSRYWKPTTMDKILAKALLVYWPQFRFL
ncbi:MAG: S26 family signal peptidase [Spirochaetaceae bacterium]|nr:S26 family signal peptidase [Spirochaetaceae bacterium]MCF7948458.1 S26 family signal peptidase [Spirochaetia bacterium]MCF7950138.1 S26 family signal peptidase [Spirochaetaceae bacterium]